MSKAPESVEIIGRKKRVGDRVYLTINNTYLEARIARITPQQFVVEHETGSARFWHDYCIPASRESVRFRVYPSYEAIEAEYCYLRSPMTQELEMGPVLPTLEDVIKHRAETLAKYDDLIQALKKDVEINGPYA